MLLESLLRNFILSCHFLNDHWNDENNKYFMLKGQCIQVYLSAMVPHSLEQKMRTFPSLSSERWGTVTTGGRPWPPQKCYSIVPVITAYVFTVVLMTVNKFYFHQKPTFIQ